METFYFNVINLQRSVSYKYISNDCLNACMTYKLFFKKLFFYIRQPNPFASFVWCHHTEI